MTERFEVRLGPGRRLVADASLFERACALALEWAGEFLREDVFIVDGYLPERPDDDRVVWRLLATVPTA